MEGVRSFPKFMKTFKKIEPLNNFQIIDKCKELRIRNFKGVFMRDELKDIKSSKNECLILNHDDSSSGGTHWTCLFIKRGIAIYFDSYGFDLPLEVVDYCKGLNGYCSTFKIQEYNEVICGHYSIFMVYRLSNGNRFFDVLDELYRN